VALPTIYSLSLRQATINVFPDESQGLFGFVQNIQRDLDSEAAVHNPWWVVTIPRPVQVHDKTGPQQLVELAAYIRQVIMTARSQEFLQDMLHHFKIMDHKPMYPRSQNLNVSEVIVSSSSLLPCYEMGLPKADGQDAFPEYTDISIDSIDISTSVGLAWHDTVLSWQDKQDTGFLICASLHIELWHEIARIRDGASLWSPGSEVR
jgi:hypothetical protein